jgi:hypothetical protein
MNVFRQLLMDGKYLQASKFRWPLKLDAEPTPIIYYISLIHAGSACTNDHSLCMKLFDMIYKIGGVTSETLLWNQNSAWNISPIDMIARAPGPLFDRVCQVINVASLAKCVMPIIRSAFDEYSGNVFSLEHMNELDRRAALVAPHLPIEMLGSSMLMYFILTRGRVRTLQAVLARQFELLVCKLKIIFVYSIRLRTRPCVCV